MLAIDGLKISYGPIQAVRDVALNVTKNEIVSVIGPNGAGKTSTLKAVVRLVKPSAGRIVFEGQSLLDDVTEGVVRRGIAIVPEGRRILATMTVEENLRIGATARRDGGFEQDLVRMLDRFPVLRKYLRANAGKLSGGEQQQLAIARALMSRPRLLLLDEPSLGLSPRNVDLVFALLKELNEQGLTMLLVEQNARRALSIANRVYVMSSGRVRLEGDPTELGGSEELERAYLG